MSELGAALPAILDAISRADLGIVVFFYHDGQFERLHANPPALRYLGFELDEWKAAPMFQIVIPEQRELVRELYERLVTADELPPALEVTLRHKLGHLLRTEMAIGRLSVDGGCMLVLAIRDPMPNAPLSLLEADRVALVGALASGFAHETNNPLTSVLLNLRSLRKQVTQHVPDQAQPAALRCLDDITTGAERIASNVRALQTLATRSATQKIDLAAVVSAALRLAAPTLEPHAHVIRQIFPVAPVVGEESRIGQAVLAMLLFSSSGFDDQMSTSGNRIVVCVEERDGSIVVEVTDNGRTVTTEEARRAFDPFFRSHARGAGVGVGLGVARSVAMTLGGDVTLAPRESGGAVITMRLPAVSEPRRG